MANQEFSFFSSQSNADGKRPLNRSATDGVLGSQPDADGIKPLTRRSTWSPFRPKSTANDIKPLSRQSTANDIKPPIRRSTMEMEKRGTFQSCLSDVEGTSLTGTWWDASADNSTYNSTYNSSDNSVEARKKAQENAFQKRFRKYLPFSKSVDPDSRLSSYGSNLENAGDIICKLDNEAEEVGNKLYGFDSAREKLAKARAKVCKEQEAWFANNPDQTVPKEITDRIDLIDKEAEEIDKLKRDSKSTYVKSMSDLHKTLTVIKEADKIGKKDYRRLAWLQLAVAGSTALNGLDIKSLFASHLMENIMKALLEGKY